MATKGIDVSRWQGAVDFKKVKAAGYDFVIINAGYGRYSSQKDPYFERNYKNAKAAGLGVGAYWYSYATTAADAEAEAKVFAQVIDGKQFEYPVAYDIEDPTQAGLSNKVVNAMCDSFIGYLEKQGYYACLYSYTSFIKSKIHTSTLKKYDLWLAEFTTAKSPSYDGAYGIWQHSSTGKVNGITGAVDLNVAYKDYPSIMISNGLNGFPKTTIKPVEEKTVIPGDVDGDGAVTVADINAVSAYVKGKTKLDATAKKAADMNGDDVVDVTDVSAIANKVKGSTTSKSTSTKSKWETYTVKANDTLTAIAKKFGVSIVQIAVDNNIKNVNIIYTGQKLKIRKD